MSKTKRVIVLFVVVLLSLFFVHIYNKEGVKATEEYQERVQDYRAAWVSHFAGDLSAYKDEASYKQSITIILDNMQALNMNAIVFHVRTHNNAFYRSELNPKSRYYDKVNFDEFDPVAWIIEECHKRGMEFHAWLNPYRVSTAGNNPDYTYESLPASNPANDPNNLLTVGDSIILDPGRPVVRDFIVDTCMELIENYDVDAIHFDDYFYISGCDDSATRAIYNTKNLSIDNFRREQVNLLIEALHNSISNYNLENNKTVEIGIAPSGVYRNGSYSSGTIPQYDENGTLTSPLYSNTSGFAHYGNYLYSDTKYWIDREWIDYITPQSYHAIKQKSSSFINLTEWWSWCVRYKKVNLSMGIGIYMVLENGSSGQNWKDEDELYKQMMNANQYDEIHGLCFYKYSSLLSSNTLMQGHVQTIKNLWQHYVPCPVKPQYTYLPEPIVRNITLDGTTLSWDALEDVRGYMVWKVGLTDKVDTENINQLYKYVTTNSIDVDIEPGYKYYVSSVNLANEISIPMTYVGTDLANEVVSLINQITFPVTLEQKDLINSIELLINELSSEELQKVTNIDLFYTAKNMCEAIESIKAVGKQLEESLTKDVDKAYLLPLFFGDYSVSWEYQDSDSANYYDISTGQRKVEYLATTYANLKYTLEKDGISYSNTIKLNVGYTKTDEIALFYRNTPHALNIEEDPTSTGSYIGWSGHVLKFTKGEVNYVFFLVVGNYHELTSSDIPENNWVSCGDFYINRSGSTITKQASAFDVSTSTNYGYFIISANGTVRKAVSTATASETISLANGEALYCIKYLDGLINDSVMKPASNMEGLTVELITPNLSKELSSNELVILVNNEISKINNPVTLVQKEHILRTINLRSNLTSEEQQLLDNTRLNNAYSDLLQLMEQDSLLEQYRNQKIEEISTYITDLTLYSSDKITEIENIIASFNVGIKALNTESAIDDLVVSTKLRLDKVLTKAEEDLEFIDEKRDQAKYEICNYILDANAYSSENQELIASTINTYCHKIDNENICDKVDELVLECEAILRSIPTILQETKDAATQQINDFVDSLDFNAYDSQDQASMRALIQTAKSKITKATSISSVNTIVTNFFDSISQFETIEEKQAKLQSLKQELIQSINDFFAEIKPMLHAPEISEANEIISTYTDLINNAQTEGAATNHKNQAITSLNELPKDEILPVKTEYSGKADEYLQSHTFTDYNQANLLVKKFKSNINSMTEAQDIEHAYLALEEELSLLIKESTTPSGNNSFSCNMGFIVPVFAAMALIFVFIKKKN